MNGAIVLRVQQQQKMREICRLAGGKLESEEPCADEGVWLKEREHEKVAKRTPVFSQKKRINRIHHGGASKREVYLRVLKLSTIVNTSFFSYECENFRIPEFSSGFLKFNSGLFV